MMSQDLPIFVAMTWVMPEPMTMRKALSLAAHGLGTGGFYLGISGGMFVLSGSMPLEGASAEDFANKLLLLHHLL